MAGKQFVQCTCGNYVELRKGFFGGWQKTVCTCGKEVKMSNSRMKTMHCDVCQIDMVCDITKPAACPICKKSFQAVQAKPFTTRCPNTNCGAMVSFAAGEDSITCPVCGQTFDPQKVRKADETLRQDSGTVIRCGDTGSDWSIVKVERTNFPVDAMVQLMPGAATLVAAGSHVYRVESSNKRLQDMEALMAYAYEDGGRRLINCDVYFVRSKLDVNFVWGAPLKAVDRLDVYDVRHQGSATIALTDAAKFLEWMNYRPCKIADLNVEMVRTSSGGVMPRHTPDTDRLWKLLEPCFQRGLDQAVLRNPDIPVNRLGSYPQLMLDALQDAANAILAQHGMAMYGAAFNNGVSIQGKGIGQRIACNVEWATAPIDVYARDRREFYAKLVLGGSGVIRVADVPRLLGSSDGQFFTDEKTTSDMISRRLGERIGKLATNQFEDLLHSLIRQENPPLNQLSVFFRGCCSALQSMLNEPQGLLGSIGLSVQHMSLEQKSFTPSPALKQEMENVDVMATVSRQEELRKFAQRVNYNRRVDEIDMRLEIGKLENEAEIAEAKSAAEVEAVTTQLEHESDKTDMRNKAELEGNAYDLAYQKWQREEQFNEASTEAEIRRAMRKTEAEHISQLEQARHDQTMDRIAQEKERARYDWQQKVEDDRRDRSRADLRDAAEQRAFEKKTAADADYYVGQAQLKLNREAGDAKEEAARREEERAERIRQAEFARDLTIRQMDAYEEMNRFRQELAREVQMREAEKVACEQAAEIEKMRLTLEYMTKVSADEAAKAQYRSQKEYAQAMAEREYAQRHAQEEQQRREREERERSERIERDAQRADALVQKVLEVQKTLETLKQHDEHAYLTGVAQAQQSGRAAVDAAKLDRLTKAIQGLIRELRDQKQAKPQGATPAAPLQGGGQPGVDGYRNCPKCGQKIYGNYCAGCNLVF